MPKRIYLISDPETCQTKMVRGRSRSDVRRGDSAITISGPYASINDAMEGAAEAEAMGETIAWSTFQ